MDLNPRMDICAEFGINEGTREPRGFRADFLQETVALAVSSLVKAESREATCPGCTSRKLVTVERNAVYHCDCRYNGWIVRYNKNSFGAFLTDNAVRVRSPLRSV